ncbi:hypothetical protein EUGRSUZ_E01142 [Eucalyptus grandis]|uniref:Uncharacterized protein n=2 Tax=Eucalyptus grandis TaxID=71139 RepID=A0ACC3KUD2_EUCGR|nr:hypothetical protein EUGRSUZ_E01142 [Eucalyptus grandis]
MARNHGRHSLPIPEINLINCTGSPHLITISSCARATEKELGTVSVLMRYVSKRPDSLTVASLNGWQNRT